MQHKSLVDMRFDKRLSGPVNTYPSGANFALDVFPNFDSELRYKFQDPVNILGYSLGLTICAVLIVHSNDKHVERKSIKGDTSINDI